MNQQYTVKFCQLKEEDLLKEFIENNWKKGHVFTKPNKLLHWQHFDEVNQRYNFVVALNNATGKFDAVLGFIPSSKFDNSLIENKDIWLAIWKIKDGIKDISGMQLLFFLNTKLKPNTICSIGITNQVENIYKALKYNQGILNHYYVKSKFRKTNIATLSEHDMSEEESNFTIKEVDIVKNENDITKILSETNYGIVKTFEFFINRYVNHPYYKYSFFGIYENTKLISFFILRKINISHSYVLRIVDFQGPFVNKNILIEIQKILKISKADYLDFLCHVEDDSNILKMGFNKKDNIHEIIPEYFEPFVKANKQIKYAYKSKYKEFRIFKGDSDQDRPNILLGDEL